MLAKEGVRSQSPTCSGLGAPRSSTAVARPTPTGSVWIRCRDLVDVFDDRDRATSPCSRARSPRAIIPAIGPSRPSPGSARLRRHLRGRDRRRHPLRRAEQLCSWAGLTPNIGSPTPPCPRAHHQERLDVWCAGRRSRPSATNTAPNANQQNYATASPTASPQDRPGRRRPGNPSPSPTTACETVEIRCLAQASGVIPARTQPARVVVERHDPLHVARSGK